MTAKLWIWSCIAFPRDAEVAGISVLGGKGVVAQLALAFREFVAPRYRPELHYMRGPGPASARRVSSLKAGPSTSAAVQTRQSRRSSRLGALQS
jgi:hypothetical protein